MRGASFSLQSLFNPKLAVHAISAAPAWVWTPDGARILWANAAGSALFNARDNDELMSRAFTLADPYRRQIAQLSGRLPVSGAVRLERLRGFGAPLGTLMTCGCARVTLADQAQGCLIAATHPAGRAVSLKERVLAFLARLGRPAAAFQSNGDWIGSNASSTLTGDLASAGPTLLDAASRAELNDSGRAEIATELGRVMLCRIGSDTESVLIALLPETVTHNAGRLEPNPAPQRQPIPHESSAMPVAADPAAASPQAQDHLVDLAEPAATETVSGNDAHEERIEPSDAFPELRHDVEEIAGYGESSSHDGLNLNPDTVSESLSMPDNRDLQSEPEAKPETSAKASEPATAAIAPADESDAELRRHPLRFLWQMDAEGRFSFGSDEFARVIGKHTAAAFGRLWSEVAEALALDPEHLVAEAVTTRNTFGGIVLQWPVDGFGARLPVELSGLPLFDGNRDFAGYRGFGICRDLDGLARIEAQRRHDTLFDPATSHGFSAASTSPPTEVKTKEPVPSLPAPATPVAEIAAAPEATLPESSQPPVTEENVEPPQNVVPFRSASGDSKQPTLTPVENNAFQEIARQLSERLESEASRLSAEREHVDAPASADAPEAVPAIGTDTPGEAAHDLPPHGEPAREEIHDEPAHAAAQHLQPALAGPAPPAAPAPQLFDHLPTGVLVYRLDRLLYANPAFLTATGYTTLSELNDDGGLDALYVETGSPESEGGRPITISTPRMGDRPGLKGHLHHIPWGGDSALALMLSAAGAVPQPTEIVVAPAPAASVPAPEETSSDSIQVEELAAILETTAEGVMIFDGVGRIAGSNRSAEALFGLPAADIAGKNLTDLFAPESQRALLDYLDAIKAGTAQSVLDHGREVLGRTPEGGIIPLSVTMGRTRPSDPRYFAVFRDRTPAPVSAPAADSDTGRRSSERLAGAKADMLARLSHEIRMPVNAIIGFAEVMIEERFGPLGNERYLDYMKDIRASGERVISIIDDMLDLSRIESGKLDLSFTSQDLNALIEQCVGVMQPQANRERIIIRSSLTHGLPHVRADARALRQIALNLIGCSIHFANAGGQVIVSTAVTDLGEIALRVRDTGHGLNDNEIAAAMAPFRTSPPDEVAHDGGANLSLTKALVEANRGRFHIKSAPNTGTLIEVVFDQANATA